MIGTLFEIVSIIIIFEVAIMWHHLEEVKFQKGRKRG